MDIALLTTTAWATLQPFLPVIATKAAEEIGKKVPEAVQKAWGAIKKKFDTKAAAKEALEDLLKAPGDGDAQGAFRSQLKKLLADDTSFAADLASLLEAAGSEYKAHVFGDGAIAQGDNSVAVGARGVYIGGKASDNTIITGDYNKVVKPEPEVSHGSLREAYLTHIFESTASLALSGIDRKTASESNARLSLGAVYTALMTLSSEDHDILQKGRRADVERLMARGENRRASVIELLNRNPRLVLLGDPGSGKSTFVNFAALCLSGAGLGKEPGLSTLTAPLPRDEEERPQPWDHGALLPVRVILRDFAARGLPPAGQKTTAKTLWDFITTELETCALGDFGAHLRKELLETGGLLMLDGLDEVPEAQQRRTQIKMAVEDFAAAYPKCRILVTSRTYAYQRQDWRLNGFSETVLAAFTKSQIRSFVDRWYAHIAVLRSLNTQDSQGRAELLKRAIFNSDSLLGLAERPLLLTLMASLHAWRGGTLPDKREELYSDTVDLLLDWWESPKVVRDARGEIINQQPSLAEWLKVDRQKVRDLLNSLAYTAHGTQPDLSGTADIAEADLVAGLMRISKNPDVNPAQLVEYLAGRAGLLLPRGVGVHTFPHRTFQEYLAACYLTDHGYPDEVARLAREDPNRWREVALLASAKASRGGAFALWPLVDAMCNTDPSEKPANGDTWGALLAGQAIAEVIATGQVSTTNQPKLDRVKHWQVNIMQKNALPAIERARAGNTLAALGDPRFDPDRWYLPKDENLFGFVRIPAGKFIMGGDRYDDEKPQHEVDLPYDYWMAKYPVTVAQFRAYAAAKGKEEQFARSLGVPDNHPVTKVSWHEALAYCAWLQKELSAFSDQLLSLEGPFWNGIRDGKLRVTLPSEAEWEKAARGTDGRNYPWGEKPDPNNANYNATGIGDTSAVGCFPGGASPYGLLDMSGNVWEWTRSLWGKDLLTPEFKYPYNPKDARREDLRAHDEIRRVLRGGFFADNDVNVRCACRFSFNPHFRRGYYGFRVVVCSPFFSR